MPARRAGADRDWMLPAGIAPHCRALPVSRARGNGREPTFDELLAEWLTSYRS